MRLFGFLTALGMGVATSAAAEDLIQVYDVAVESDSLRKEAEQLV